MWALLNKYNFVLDCFVGISFEDAKQYETDGRYLVEMTLKNSPAYLGGFYDGKQFFPKDYKPFEGEFADLSYYPFVLEKHGYDKNGIKK